MKKLLTAVLGAVLLFTAVPAQADHHEEVATQGWFAARLMTALHWNWEGMTQDDAIKALTGHKVAPQGGWQADKQLTNGAMDQVFHQIYASFDTNAPSETVTVAEAEGLVLDQEEETWCFNHWRNILYRMSHCESCRGWMTCPPTKGHEGCAGCEGCKK